MCISRKDLETRVACEIIQEDEIEKKGKKLFVLDPA
jgi:hypothetical protein